MKKESAFSAAASLWCARFVHVGITVGIASVLLSKDTVLRKDIEEGHAAISILYILATIISIVLYFVVACMDPGFVKKEDPDITELKLILDDGAEEDDMSLYESGQSNDCKVEMHQTDDSVATEKTKMLNGEKDSSVCFNLEPHQRCGLCGLQRPIRARHCRECKHCVRKFDHHCPWITNCVGERNHRWFWLFLFVEIVLLAWSIYISITGYTTSTEGWVSQNILLVIVDIVMAILTLVVLSLFCIHTYMILGNHTTWESMSRHRISYLKGLDISVNPFNLGICRNISTFFCYFQPYDWTVIYSKTNRKDSEPASELVHSEYFYESTEELELVQSD